jgi:hypothetical protein
MQNNDSLCVSTTGATANQKHPVTVFLGKCGEAGVDQQWAYDAISGNITDAKGNCLSGRTDGLGSNVKGTNDNSGPLVVVSCSVDDPIKAYAAQWAYDRTSGVIGTVDSNQEHWIVDMAMSFQGDTWGSQADCSDGHYQIGYPMQISKGTPTPPVQICNFEYKFH